MADGVGGPDAVSVWTAASAAVGAALGAFGLWLANRMLGKAAFQSAINDGFKGLTDQLQEERTALRAELERERESARAELNDERLAGARERAQLRGEIINLTQTIEGLKRLLRVHGIDIPMSASERTVDRDARPMIELTGPQNPRTTEDPA